MRTFLAAVYLFCLTLVVLWIVVTPTIYLINHHPETISQYFSMTKLPSWVFGAWWLASYTLVPWLLVSASVRLFRLGMKPRTLGIILGVAAALWATTLLLTFGYGGGYANLFSAFLGSVASRGVNDGPAYYVTVLVSNMVFWPIVCWLIVWWISRKRRMH